MIMPLPKELKDYIELINSQASRGSSATSEECNEYRQNLKYYRPNIGLIKRLSIVLSRKKSAYFKEV